MCPKDRLDGAFYLKPLKNPKGIVWFEKLPLGHNFLSNMINRIMNAAGIKGHFTNHSLRSTATTRLFNAHVDEQLIMNRTGHSSTKGVRNYKRISDQLVEETSNILNGKRQKTEAKENLPPTVLKKMDEEEGNECLPKETIKLPYGINVASSANITFNINVSYK